MSMRKSTRQELRKSRELLWFLLRGKCCFFCKKPLLNGESYAKDGDGQGSPIARLITIHHVDLDQKALAYPLSQVIPHEASVEAAKIWHHAGTGDKMTQTRYIELSGPGIWRIYPTRNAMHWVKSGNYINLM